jgi:hypothetical protein
MAVVEFVYSKEEAQGGQIHELKYKVETVGPKLRRCTLLDDREMRTRRGSFAVTAWIGWEEPLWRRLLSPAVLDAGRSWPASSPTAVVVPGHAP